MGYLRENFWHSLKSGSLSVKLVTRSMPSLRWCYNLGALLTCNCPVHAFNSVPPHSIIWGKHIPQVSLVDEGGVSV